MSTFIILGIEDVLELHRRQIGIFGGMSGLRDAAVLESACHAPHNVLFYENGDLVDCAAALMWHLCCDHPFLDGNKRIGTVAGIVMLSVNGTLLPDDDALPMRKLIELMVDTADHRTTRQDITNFIRRYL
ncbi:MAG: type II toxin-antitoxin system death-on-curing family toxin [Holophaga sp.]|nr:type II toxin-antitoxin system death-on-curing family toxin [Holophaga sp.]